MDENPNSASNIIGSILGSGGIGSVATGAGDLVCAIKGNCAPKSLTVVNQAPQQGMNMMPVLLIGGGVLLVIVMFMVLGGGGKG